MKDEMAQKIVNAIEELTDEMRNKGKSEFTGWTVADSLSNIAQSLSEIEEHLRNIKDRM